MRQSPTTGANRQAGYHATLTHWSPLDGLDADDPLAVFALAHREAPVFFNEFYDGWVVAGYHEALTVLGDAAAFSSRGSLGSGCVPDHLRTALPDGPPWDHPTLINNDPPDHARIRARVSPALRPRAVSPLTESIAAIAEDCLARVASRPELELLSAFAAPFTARVLCRALGLPEQAIGDLERWSDEKSQLGDPALAASERDRILLGQADFGRFCAGVLEEHRRAPGDDVLSRLVTREASALTNAKLVSVVSQLVLGAEAMRRFLGNLLLRVLQHPSQLEAIRRRPQLAESAVEEALRHSSSVRGLPRVCRRGTSIAGVSIPQGARVVVMWSAANRDPSVFERPEQFDILRPDAGRHLAFSRYRHFCLGSALARLEAAIALTAVVRRLPGLRLDAGYAVRWLPLATDLALARLDVERDAAAGVA